MANWTNIFKIIKNYKIFLQNLRKIWNRCNINLIIVISIKKLYIYGIKFPTKLKLSVIDSKFFCLVYLIITLFITIRKNIFKYYIVLIIFFILYFFSIGLNSLIII